MLAVAPTPLPMRAGASLRTTRTRRGAWRASQQQSCGSRVVAVAARGEEDAARGSDVDVKYMRECIALAKNGLGKTDPNPMVGCVIVRDGKVLGRGYHPKAGEAHAEIFALRDAGLDVSTQGHSDAKEWTVVGSEVQGATAYVSLEPCNHVGRTPPCSRALVAAGVSRVVVGMVDPDPRVSGGGVNTLETAGIQVVVGVEEAQCRELNKDFIERVTREKQENKQIN